eukprot:7335539-Alexandrium_andersonii.AAC.1
MEELRFTFDSGAVDAAAPPGIGEAFTLRGNQASKEGRYYRAANNTKIAILGMKQVQGLTEDGQAVGMEVQIAEVKKPLASVRGICQAGNRV